MAAVALPFRNHVFRSNNAEFDKLRSLSEGISALSMSVPEAMDRELTMSAQR